MSEPMEDYFLPEEVERAAGIAHSIWISHLTKLLREKGVVHPDRSLSLPYSVRQALEKEANLPFRSLPEEVKYPWEALARNYVLPTLNPDYYHHPLKDKEKKSLMTWKGISFDPQTVYDIDILQVSVGNKITLEFDDGDIIILYELDLGKIEKDLEMIEDIIKTKSNHIDDQLSKGK